MSKERASCGAAYSFYPLVMLHTRNRWHDAAAMLDRAFMRKGKVPFANSSSVELRGIGNDEEGN